MGKRLERKNIAKRGESESEREILNNQKIINIYNNYLVLSESVNNQTTDTYRIYLPLS